MPWELTGNAGSNPATDFLGTTDGQPLAIRTNGSERMRITPNGDIGVGTANPSFGKLEISSTGDRAYLVIDTTSGANKRTRLNFSQSGTLGMEIGTDYNLNNTDDLYIFNRATGQPAAYFNPKASGTGGAIWLSSRGTSTDFYIDGNGNVGIGTMSPLFRLTNSSQGNVTDQQPSGLAGGNSFVWEHPSSDTTSGYTAALLNSTSGFNANGLLVKTTDTSSSSRILTLDSGGTDRLVVLGNGDVRVTGDIVLTNADCAEEFDISEATDVEPGTVVVLDQDGTLRQSEFAYDKRVAGVISGAGDYKPGIILDKQQLLPNRKPVALVGKVYCKVDARYAAIEVGALLTTSPTPGHAMKAVEPQRAFGSIIGKALKPLEEGQGLIPILVALQ